MTPQTVDNGPLDAITISLPPGSFENIRDDIKKESTIFHTANQPESRFSLKQDYTLQQIASTGIISMLQRMQVEGATELLGELSTQVEEDPLTDLTTVIGHREGGLHSLVLELETSEQNEDPTDSDYENERLLKEKIKEEKRLILLAEAVGGTASSMVAALTGNNPEAIRLSIDRAERGVKAAVNPELNSAQIGNSIGSVAGQALGQMLNKIATIPLPEES